MFSVYLYVVFPLLLLRLMGELNFFTRVFSLVWSSTEGRGRFQCSKCPHVIRLFLWLLSLLLEKLVSFSFFVIHNFVPVFPVNS